MLSQPAANWVRLTSRSPTVALERLLSASIAPSLNCSQPQLRLIVASADRHNVGSARNTRVS